ncbi:hypothetical protein ABT263_08285 [Kitasatospora sp. NPDC001603]|uniref:hypothetical protein n=1 Tax=Kitasatospora sp. NPDC001603 TaxID=3154388 RepID=UPI00332D62CE
MKTRLTSPEADPDEIVSDSERFLFGGRLRYDYGFTSHEQTMLKISSLTVARQIPGMLRTAIQLTWHADRAALVVIAVAEIGRTLATALGLLDTNRALSSLFSSGAADQLLRAALPTALTVGGASALSALLGIASSWAGDRLEPPQAFRASPPPSRSVPASRFARAVVHRPTGTRTADSGGVWTAVWLGDRGVQVQQTTVPSPVLIDLGCRVPAAPADAAVMDPVVRLAGK